MRSLYILTLFIFTILNTSLLAENDTSYIYRRGFSLECGAFFAIDETTRKKAVFQYYVNIDKTDYYKGLDLGLTFQLSNLHSISIMSNLSPLTFGSFGLTFTYGNKVDKFAIGPLGAVTSRGIAYGGQLFIKNFYLRLYAIKYNAGSNFALMHNKTYVYVCSLSVGYSFRTKRINKRLFKRKI